MLLNGKTVNLVQLRQELPAAGWLPPGGLGALGTQGDDLITYDGQGRILSLPATAPLLVVLAAHLPTATTWQQALARLKASAGADTQDLLRLLGLG